MLLVTGTTVMTPRPRRVAVALPGRCRRRRGVGCSLRYLERGRRSTCQILTARITDSVADGLLPRVRVAGCRRPFSCHALPVISERSSEDADRMLQKMAVIPLVSHMRPGSRRRHRINPQPKMLPGSYLR